MTIYHSPLPKSYYLQGATSVARSILGKRLVHNHGGEILSGKIVETEAYLSADDPACHAARGMTKRNKPMFNEGGTAYVYLIYGIHYCFNVVTGVKGDGEAVLIRAIEPLTGIEHMKNNRGAKAITYNITNGPGKLCQAMNIDVSYNEASLLKGNLLVVEEDKEESFEIVSDTRIGIEKGKEKELRFYVKNNPYVSKPRKGD